jgi:uncharacterized protein
MIARLLVAAFVLALAALPAQAASFDCAKASTSFERAICDSPGLSKQDEILARAYATALGGLSRAASDAVKAGQRDWLRFVERACTDDAEPLSGTYDDDGQSCLSTLFGNRIRDLEESRMRSGRRVYMVDRYTVFPDPEATDDSFTKVTTRQVSSARIDGDDGEARGFNALMESYEGRVTTEAEGDASSDTENNFTVDSLTATRISVRNDLYWYGHGAAHGNYGVTYIHYLVAEDRELMASDLFQGQGWIAALADLAFADLQRQLGDGMWPTSPDELLEAVGDPTRWNFAERGLAVQFQPYEVTAYAAGAPTVLIAWEQLSDHLVDGAWGIIY